jgi:predicted amidohydrolase
MTPQAHSPKVALWAQNLSCRTASLADWLALVDRKAAEAKRGGAEILVLPEHCSAGWYAYMPATVPPQGELAWLAGQAPAALAGLTDIARRHGIAVLGGSMAVNEAGGQRNRAHFITPDGAVQAQDKICLTPGERDPGCWMLSSGNSINVFDWKGWKLAMVICLDIEQPHLATKLAEAGPDLILCPSMTRNASGWHRVHACARARAVELMVPVAVTGNLGRMDPADSDFHGGAACYLPCETEFGSDGKALDTGPLQSSSPGADAEGPVFFTPPLPLARIRALRAGAAEVWPGPKAGKSARVAKPVPPPAGTPPQNRP